MSKKCLDVIKTRIAEIEEAKDLLKRYREAGFNYLEQVVKDNGNSIKLEKSFEFKPWGNLVELRWSPLKIMYTKEVTPECLVAVFDKDCASIPGCSTMKMDARGNLKNTLKLWKLIEHIEKQL